MSKRPLVLRRLVEAASQGGANDEGSPEMIAEPIAVQMAIQSTHRNVNDAARERAPRPRRATARVLQAIAIRLDPAEAQKPQLS